MMHSLQNSLCLLSCLWAANGLAQQSINLELPDMQISADRILRGDGDTYGLGDWKCTFTLSLDGSTLNVAGIITFTENANDFTTIVGTYQQQIVVEELARCRYCGITLAETRGTVSGPNIGARGYRWFQGQGLIRRAKIRTDVFGEDVGNIGGTIQFEPVRVLLDCSVAMGRG